MNASLKSLIGKLNHSTRNALEAAAGLCVSRTHYDVEVEHYLAKLLDSPGGDFDRIAQRFGIDRSRLEQELAHSLDLLKTGNARTPAFSPSLVKALSEAWTFGSLEYGMEEIRTGATILALLADPDLARMTREISRELNKIDVQALQAEFLGILAGSVEDSETLATPASAEGAAPAPGAGKTPNLDKFTVDLTENARIGKIDPVLGRDREIRQVVDILMRRRQNNPILTGEAGVGKTAVVEGFALRIAAGDVPPPLEKRHPAHAGSRACCKPERAVKGEFENRLKGLIEEVKESPSPIILFIDEAHTMIGAGGAAGQGDAANLLKPALARGELRTIAATTWAEYKKYFEKDAALARRFQVVKVEEPGRTGHGHDARPRAARSKNITASGFWTKLSQAAVRLSHRYIAGPPASR